jgi:hypothetical protein
LPIDPVNNVSHYYTYVTGGSWALSALLESERRLREQANKDGGFNPGKFEVGTNLRLIALSEGLVGWWPFEEGSGTTARDASKTGNTGTLHHGPTWQPPANCKQGRCLRFDGVDDFVNVLHAASLNITDAITMEFWLWLTDLTGNDMWIDKDRNVSYNIHFTDPTDKIRVMLAGTFHDSSFTFTPATLNKWVHIAVTFDRNLPANQSKLYINGTLDSVFTRTAPMGANTLPVRIGVDHGAAHPFGGRIDEIRIYNRALSAPEIQAIYSATK